MKNILIIEDDIDIGNILQMILTKNGFAVTILNNASGIAALIKDNIFDLVCLDMLLSGKTSIDICRDIKNTASSAHIPVMMMSAHSDAKMICLQAGAHDFISKPFDLNDLLDKINKLLFKGPGI